MAFAGNFKRRWLLLWAAAAIALAGCGGGGGDGTGEPGGSGGDAMGLEARTQATNRLAAQFEQITGGGAADAAQWEQLRAWVMTQPEFIDAGVGDRILWAQFSDGRYFVYTDNWSRLPPANLAPAALQRSAPRALAAAAPAGIVPGASRAAVLSHSGAPGDNEFVEAIPVMGHMVEALAARGWTVDPQRALTVQAFKNLGELGFLYVTSHSAVWGPTGKKQFSIMLDDMATLENDVALHADLREDNLIYHRDRTLWQTLGVGSPPRYAATDKFVRKYLRFSPGSLMIMLSCHSGSAESENFRKELHAKGLGTLIGWDGNSNKNAFRPMGLLVDRLAGANKIDPVTPANRAFGFDDVWRYLEKKGLTVTPDDAAGVPVRRFGAGFTKLAPVVAALQARGDKLVIHGDLGTEQGTVTVGGVAVQATWATDGRSAVATLANATHGEVVVKVKDRTSNPRVLGAWRGSVTYRRESEEVSGCGGAKFHNTMAVDLHLRADMHGVRDEVDGPVRNNPHYLIPAPDTRGSWSAGGVCDIAGETHTRWSGSGNSTFDTSVVIEEGPVQGNFLMARIDAVEQRFQLNGVFGQHERKTVLSLGNTSQEPLIFDTELFGFVNNGPDYTRLLPFGTFLPFSGQLEVAGDQQRRDDPVHPHAMDIRWSAWPVSPAYDDRIGR